MAQKKPNHVKTKGLMSVDKSRTSLGMKIVLLVIALTMVLSFIPIVGSLFSSNSTGTTAGTTGTVKSEADAEAQFKPQVDALQAKLATTPDDRTSLVSLGNAYFDWANALSGVVSDAAGQAKVSSYFALAADAYEKAIAIKDESPVEVDYAFALYNSGETTKAVSVSESVSEKDPTFSMAWFSLGLFKRDAGDNAAAKAAFEKYLELDTTNQYGNRDSAQQYIDAL